MQIHHSLRNIITAYRIGCDSFYSPFSAILFGIKKSWELRKCSSKLHTERCFKYWLEGLVSRVQCHQKKNDKLNECLN